MNKLFVFLSVVLLLVNSQSIGQKPGSVLWSRLIDPSTFSDTIHSVKVQTDGKIVVAGDSYGASYMAISIGRFDKIGIRDSSFSINGIATLSLDSAYTVANAMEIQPDGKIVVAGVYQKGTAGNFLIARFNSDGSPDSSFGINGIVRTEIDSGSFDGAHALAIQTDGKIIAAGWAGSSLAVCRYNTDGSPDSSFDLDGKLMITILGGSSVTGASSVQLQSDGKIVLCCRYLVIRLEADGSLDLGFGTNAVATLYSTAFSMAIQNDGKILVAGSDFTLERLDTAGIHDNSFGTGGVVNTPKIYTGALPSQTATSVCVQSDGRILASGWARAGMGQVNFFAVARYLANGAADSSFGTLGRLFSSGGANFYSATSYSSVINKNEVILGGNAGSSFANWAMVCYYLGPPLAVPKAPGVDGQIIVVPNPAEEFAHIHSAHIANGNWLLSLYDLTGRILYSETVAVTNNAIDKDISLVGLPAATYQVKLDNGIGRLTVKLTKSRQ